jgi:nitrite reductase (NADH) small subunit
MQQRIIGTLGQIPRGEGRNFVVDGKPIAVFHTSAGEVFATQAACPHRGGPLADGLLGGTHLMCPLHDRLFDLRTGRALGTDCAIAVYPVKVADGGSIVLTLEPEHAMAAE